MNLNEECLLQYLQTGSKPYRISTTPTASFETEPKLLPTVYRHRHFVSFPVDMVMAQIQRILM